MTCAVILEIAMIIAGCLPWLWVMWDASRPRYYDDMGGVHRTAQQAEDASND
jgi:hypothetical protein